MKPSNATDNDGVSCGWRYAALFVVMTGLAVLFGITASTYMGRVGPPIPARVVDQAGEVVFTGDDITAGQQVFLKHAIMENGTIWGHGAYLGPDFSAQYLHELVLDTQDDLAMRAFRRPFTQLSSEEQSMAQMESRKLLRENRYDSATGTLVYSMPEASSFRHQIGLWKDYFDGSRASRGLPPKTIVDMEELRQLTAFFSWTAWACAANAPGKTHSYTGNFPYEPSLGNGPSAEAVLWSTLSLIALLAGTAAVLFAFGRFNFLGWKSSKTHIHPQLLPGVALPSQRATVKYFVVVALLFMAQALVGGAVPHFRAEPGNFYGIDLSALQPSNVLRTWHLQMAIFRVATAFVGGGLYLASAMGGKDPRWQTTGVNALWAALSVVILGSLAGEFFGARQMMGRLWFWFGNQGWEYLEIGRGWQILLAAGLLFWVALLVRAVGPALRDPRQKEIAWLFLIAAFTIPVFYLPAFFFGSTTHLTIVETWRFWIIHLWVEGFFEVFVTVMVAAMFLMLGMVSRQTALRVIYLDAILFLGSGIIGTGHHWYWAGQSDAAMALSATFSAMEVVPLILLTLDATDFTNLMRSQCDICGRRIDLPHRWTFNFLIAVGVWNFIGAGIFGFLINLPVVSYYEVGTNLTANHAHSAFIGVFGMLGMALLVFVLRQTSTDAHWLRMEKYIRISFWGLNIGLAGMVVMNLFPSGVLQFIDTLNNGYWHARGPGFSDQRLIMFLEWLRMPADLVFIFMGIVPIMIVTLLSYKHVRSTDSEKEVQSVDVINRLT